MSQAMTALRAESLSFRQVPHTSRLFLDFLYDFPKVERWYAQAPFQRDWKAAKAAITEAAYPAARRERMAVVLERQNRSFGAGSKTLANIERLRAGAHVVVTGQQVGLFGGPLYCLLKAMTAVKLAAEATAAGVDTVPIFWLAAEDHDLAEVNHVYFASQSGPCRIEVSSKGKGDAPVGSIVFGDEIIQPVAVATDALRNYHAGGPSLASEEIITALRECYAPGETFASAYAKFWTKLTSHWGLILLDGSDPELDRVAQPLYVLAVERAGEITDALVERGRELDRASYHAQVKVTASSTLLFSMHDGVRQVIHRSHPHSGETEFTAGAQRYTQDDLRRLAQDSPELLSPNALFRPIVQDYLLPTLAYVGGGAEIAYFAQSAVVFDKLLGRRTAVLPRMSATLVEPNAAKLLDRYGLNVHDLLVGPDSFARLLAKRQLPGGLLGAFSATDAALQSVSAELSAQLELLDSTLTAAAQTASRKMAYQLNKLRERAARAELRRNELLTRHAATLSGTLYPFGGLQERALSGAEFVARHGFEWLASLTDALDEDCPDHQVVTL